MKTEITLSTAALVFVFGGYTAVAAVAAEIEPYTEVAWALAPGSSDSAPYAGGEQTRFTELVNDTCEPLQVRVQIDRYKATKDHSALGPTLAYGEDVGYLVNAQPADQWRFETWTVPATGVCEEPEPEPTPEPSTPSPEPTSTPTPTPSASPSAVPAPAGSLEESVQEYAAAHGIETSDVMVELG